MDQNLLEQVNTKLANQPLIYVSIEVERALGLENLLHNYHIICYDDSPIIDQLIDKGISVHSIARDSREAGVRRNSASLLASDYAREVINKLTNGQQFYLMTFYPSKVFAYQAAQYNCQLLMNDPKLTKSCEDKLTVEDLFETTDINRPQHIIGRIDEQAWEQLTQLLHTTGIVIQTANSHTGEGTFVVTDQQYYNVLHQKLAGARLKFSALVPGSPWTVNVCITDNGHITQGLNYQITGIPELTPIPAATVGNDWGYAQNLSPIAIGSVRTLTAQVAQLLRDKGYRGVFGIDMIIDNADRACLIEINARQTANLPMQTYLEIIAEQTPLLLINLAQWLELITQSPDNQVNQLASLKGSQIFNRAKSQLSIQSSLAVGTYRLQSDNSAIDWDKMQTKDNVIYLDEAQDKPLVYQGPSYNISQVASGGFQLLVGTPGEYKPNQEIARMQLQTSIVNNEQPLPWVIEALQAIETRLV